MIITDIDSIENGQYQDLRDPKTVARIVGGELLAHGVPDVTNRPLVVLPDSVVCVFESSLERERSAAVFEGTISSELTRAVNFYRAAESNDIDLQRSACSDLQKAMITGVFGHGLMKFIRIIRHPIAYHKGRSMAEIFEKALATIEAAQHPPRAHKQHAPETKGALAQQFPRQEGAHRRRPVR